ncbi:hypothetical protein AX27061_0052 [Achromobacter xylosoxidans NBRC 15126 = ATCC 27061]|nr:hypothetical protein AX27061_0052 [Achromobacter xylosoxidans NBRC 15126 = ATCC 27061]
MQGILGPRPRRWPHGDRLPGPFGPFSAATGCSTPKSVHAPRRCAPSWCHVSPPGCL